MHHFELNLNVLVFILHIFCLLKYATSVNNIVWAVNCGGEAHVDANGIQYQKDNNPVGIASDYGKSMLINRIPREDQIIYQTERYNTANFVYDVPIPSDGDYVLVLKFSEVWFTAPNQKVFDVMLNSEHVVVERLDIFNKVGRGTAHDEIIPFKVKDGKLYVKEESSDLYYKKIQIEFIKGDRDNPKINAILLYKGSIDTIHKLPPLVMTPPDSDPQYQQDDTSHQHQQQHQQSGSTNQNEFDESMDDPEFVASRSNKPQSHKQQFQSSDKTKRKKLSSGPKSPDPYSTDDTSSMFFPLAVAIGAFLPLLFCLCKL